LIAPRSSGGAGIWLIAAGQTTGYVAQTFSFAALIVALTDPTTGAGLARTLLAAGPTLGLVVAAVLAPLMGRLVDRGQGARMLTFGPLLGAAGLMIASSAQGDAGLWLAAFAVIGLGQATTQFETCFALLTRRLGDGARMAIVRVTLVAGFSTTLAFPLGEALAARFGWAGAMVAFGVMQVLVTVPLNWAGTRMVRRQVGQDSTARDTEAADKGRLRSALRGAAFWQLAGMIGLLWMNHAVLTTFALPLLMDRGAAHDIAVMLAAALGPAQVGGRLMLVLAGDRLPLRALTMWVLCGFVAASALLLAGREVPVFWILYALTQGAAAGIASILRPLIAAEVLGRAGFGAIWGVLSVAPLSAQAAAPVLGATILGLGGPQAVVAAALVMALAALVLGLCVVQRMRDG
jgi:MFS family permease